MSAAAAMRLTQLHANLNQPSTSSMHCDDKTMRFP
jgi:hypothetical protein